MNYIKHDTSARMIAVYDQHAYTNDNQTWWPSVTNVLNIIDRGENLTKWYKSTGFNSDYLMREAQELGSLVHGLTEKFDANPDTPINQRTYDADGKVVFEYNLKAWGMLSRYVDFIKRFNPKMLAIETVMCSDNLRVGGTADRIFELNGERYLVDIKTGGNLYKEYSVQVYAYKLLWEEFFPDYPIDKLAILHLDADIRTEGKSGKDIQGIGWKLREVTDDPKILDVAWTSALNLFNWANPTWKPYFKQYADHFCRSEILNHS